MKDPTMRPNPTHPTTTGFVARLSADRFRLMMLACALVFAAELAVVHATVGLPPVGARFAVAGAP
jgi:hypothetical protein